LNTLSGQIFVEQDELKLVLTATVTAAGLDTSVGSERFLQRLPNLVLLAYLGVQPHAPI
jgi:hypothetical protein